MRLQCAGRFQARFSGDIQYIQGANDIVFKYTAAPSAQLSPPTPLFTAKMHEAGGPAVVRLLDCSSASTAQWTRSR